MKRVNSFMAMNSEAQEISGKKDESSSKKAEIAQDSSTKRAGDKLESDKSKKQKTDENEEVKVDNEADLKMHMVIVKDDDIAIDAISLATNHCDWIFFFYELDAFGIDTGTAAQILGGIAGLRGSFDWSDMVEEQVQTNMALMTFSNSEIKRPRQVVGSQITEKCIKNGFGVIVQFPHSSFKHKSDLKKLDLSYSGLDEFKEPEFKAYGSKNSKQESSIVCDQKSDDSKENSDGSLVKEQVSKDISSLVESSLNVDKETIFPVDKKVEFVKPKNHEKPVKKSVRVNQENDVKASACWVWRPTKPDSALIHIEKTLTTLIAEGRRDPRFVDSGCSRHMTGNIAYLSDFKEFDGGYVTFRRGAHGGMSKEVGHRLPQSSGSLFNGGVRLAIRSWVDRMERAALLLLDLKQIQDSESRDIEVIFTLAYIDGGIDCLLTATIFEELARMGYEKPSQRLTFYKAFFSPQGKFLIYTITQCLSSKSTAWNKFTTQDEGVDSGILIDSQQTPITTQPSPSRPQKKQSRRK
ncbi:hypothetical protein Tco_0511598 [Tanacetum coccineum]